MIRGASTSNNDGTPARVRASGPGNRGKAHRNVRDWLRAGVPTSTGHHRDFRRLSESERTGIPSKRRVVSVGQGGTSPPFEENVTRSSAAMWAAQAGHHGARLPVAPALHPGTILMVRPQSQAVFRFRGSSDAIVAVDARGSLRPILRLVLRSALLVALAVVLILVVLPAALEVQAATH